jgi:hypothetical protein
MTARPARLSMIVALSAALAALASGCGNTTNTLTGSASSTAAPYLDLNGLKYQVQVSRQLNPHNAEDANYLVGLAPSQQGLAPDQAWFGVFVTVYNPSHASHLAAADFTVTDTQNNVYRPTPVATVNPFVYRQRTVGRDDQIPRLGSLPFYGPSGGAILIFKVKLSSFDNRPLQLRITDPVDPSVVAMEPLDL